MATLTREQKAHLAEHGYVVCMGVVGPDLCRRARGMIDGILGGPAPQMEGSDVTIDYGKNGGLNAASRGGSPDALPTHPTQVDVVDTGDAAVRSGNARTVTVVSKSGGGVDNRWPEPGATEPYITSGNFTHSILHPIADPVAAELVIPLVPLQADLLRCDIGDVKLLNQNFRRTDRSPPPGGGHTEGAAVKQGWHMDSAFLPWHYRDTGPAENYYISLLALSPIRPGVAPFCMVPGSLSAALKAGGELPEEIASNVDGLSCRAHLPTMLREAGVQAVIDANPQGHEVYLEEGDVLLVSKSERARMHSTPTVTQYTNTGSMSSPRTCTYLRT
jgi:hypothetical protein